MTFRTHGRGLESQNQNLSELGRFLGLAEQQFRYSFSLNTPEWVKVIKTPL